MHVYTERIQEFLKYVEYASPILPNPSPIASSNRNRKVRFSDPIIIPGHTNSFNTNVPELSSLGVIPSPQASGSQTHWIPKNETIPPAASTLKKEVEDHHRTFNSSLNKTNHVIKPNGTADVQSPKTYPGLKCGSCNGCLFSDNHDLCILDMVRKMNARVKSRRQPRKSPLKQEWKPTGKVYTKVGYMWRPTGRTFTLRDKCPVTRVSPSTKVPPREQMSTKPVTPLTNHRNRRSSKNNASISKSKSYDVLKAKHTEPNKSWGSSSSNIPSSSERRWSNSSYGTWTPVSRST